MNAGATAYVPQTLAQDCTIASTGVVTCLKTNNVPFGTFATNNFTTPPTIGGTTPAPGFFTTLSASTSFTLVGGTALTSQSSANSQIVTCPTGGSGTQVCDAAGAWVANGSGSGTVTPSPQYQVAIYPTAGTVATVQGSANLTTDAGGDFSATGKLAAGSTSVTGPMCTGVSGAWCAAENSTAGTPTSGGCYIRADSTTNALKYSCNGGAEALLVSPGFPVTTPQTVNGAPSTGSITPNQATIPNPVGQIIGTGDWYMQAPSFTIPPAPSLAINTTGGTYVNGTQLYVRLTYAGFSAGNTQPSGEVVSSAPNGMTGCSGGNSCSVTVTMPTSCTAGNLPAGATGCTVWNATGGGTNTEQIVAACTNITATTCILTAAPTGTALTFQATTGITPPNFHTSGLLSNNIVPLSWLNKSDLNNYPLVGIDTGGRNNAQPHDILTFMQPLSYNDAFQNAYYGITNTGGISIVHEMGHNVNSTCSASNLCIDPALSVRYDDAFATGTTWEQSLGMYAERFLNNTSFVCSPVSGETCAGSIRANVTDLRTGGTSLSAQGPVAGIAGAAFNNQGSSHATTPTAQAGYIGGSFLAQDGTTNAYNEGAQTYIGVQGQASDVGLGTNSIGYNFRSVKGSNFGNGNYGMSVNNFTPARNIDYGLFIDGGNIWFGGNAEGPVYLDTIATNHSTIGVAGSVGVTGDVTASNMLLPTAGTITPIGGTATTWTYRLACVSATGALSVAATDVTTNVGAANLNGSTTENAVNLPNNNEGCSSYNIYLTSTGGTCGGVSCNAPGLIGNVVVNQAPNLFNLQTASTGQFIHGTQVATGTEPTNSSNTTGSISTNNTTAATVGASQSSPFIQALGTEWNGASVPGGGQFQFIPGTGVNAPSFFQLSHFGAATGSMAFEIPNGTVINPSLVFAAGTTTGFFSFGGNTDCWTNGTVAGTCFVGGSNNLQIPDNWNLSFSQTNSASGAMGANIGIVGTGANEVLSTSTQVLVPQCKVKTAVTLSTSATTICSWNLPNSAQTWAWQCSGTYTITAGTTPDFGLGMNASQTPTSETGNALISSVSASTTSTQVFTGDSNTAAASGNQPIYTSTVAITTVTNSPWTSSGVLQASATAGTFAITGILTGTTPAGTVNPGTTCQLY
jgi:hypothetical protein